MRHYILDAERRPVLVVEDGARTKDATEELVKWLFAMAKLESKRGEVVGRAYLPGGVEVCTDFLGVATNRKGPPDVFETGAFILRGEPGHDGRGEFNIYGRCSTWEQAEAMHAECVAEYEKAARG